MIHGYVLISCEQGFEEKIIRKLRDKKEILEANRLLGMYNIIVKLESKTHDSFQDFVIWKIHKIDKVISIVSLLAKESIDFVLKNDNVANMKIKA